MGKPRKGVSPLSLTEARCSLCLGILLFRCPKGLMSVLHGPLKLHILYAVCCCLPDFGQGISFFSLQFRYLSNKDDTKNPKSYL